MSDDYKITTTFNFDLSINDPYGVITRLDVERWRSAGHAHLDQVADQFLMDHQGVVLNDHAVECSVIDEDRARRLLGLDDA